MDNRMNKKAIFTIFILLSVLVTFILLPAVPSSATGQNQTIPTLTPSPVPGGGNNGGGSSGGSSGGNNPPPPPPTATFTPAPLPTATLIPVTIAATPVGGFLPTAVPCSNQPTVQALNTTNVRPGPGTEYGDPIAQLVYLEVRLIVGRASHAPWWLIVLDNGELGWVADDVVAVSGNTNIVPVVAPPALDGSSATPETQWVLPILADCPLPPTPTATATATVSPIETPTEVPTEMSAEAVTAVPTDAPAPEQAEETAADPETAAAQFAMPAPTPDSPETAVVPTTLPPTAVPLSDEPLVSSSSVNLLPPIAAILLGVGLAVALWQRRRTEE